MVLDLMMVRVCVCVCVCATENFIMQTLVSVVKHCTAQVACNDRIHICMSCHAHMTAVVRPNVRCA
jgi:hypothetical protein